MPPIDESGIDSRDESAPFYETVALTALAAAAVMAVIAILGGSGEDKYVKLMLLGPFGLIFFEFVVHEVWWKRWWGFLPGAVAGLIIYFEGRAALTGVIGSAWAQSIAYVVAWTSFAAVFAIASRRPRTDFSASGRREDR
jgi:hypothetical protein